MFYDGTSEQYFMFIKIELKQIYCSYSRTQILQKWYSIIFDIIFEVDIAAEQKQV